ncbi:MAG: oligosaccharide flippase family protein [Planctomycetes bacterium]|nr:oligosaccharide flippase family protein [Planctomycetota bacterium]
MAPTNDPRAADTPRELPARSVVASALSYWVYSAAVALAAFVVSPIAVRELGRESYGVWTLIVSTTGFLTLLDLGVNSAVVRMVSKHAARGERRGMRVAYSTSLALLAALAGIALLALGLASPFVARWIAGPGLAPGYVQGVFCIVALDLALGIFGSAFLGGLAAAQCLKPETRAAHARIDADLRRLLRRR